METYTDQQATSMFRAEFLRTLERIEDVRWWMAPSHGGVHIRLPCPECGWAEKRAERTNLAHLDEDGATFTAVCFDHRPYEAHIDPETDYVDALAWLVGELLNDPKHFFRSFTVKELVRLMTRSGWGRGARPIRTN